LEARNVELEDKCTKLETKCTVLEARNVELEDKCTKLETTCNSLKDSNKYLMEDIILTKIIICFQDINAYYKLEQYDNLRIFCSKMKIKYNEAYIRRLNKLFSIMREKVRLYKCHYLFAEDSLNVYKYKLTLLKNVIDKSPLYILQNVKNKVSIDVYDFLYEYIKQQYITNISQLNLPKEQKKIADDFFSVIFFNLS
jgi:hypothetical protein